MVSENTDEEKNYFEKLRGSILEFTDPDKPAFDDDEWDFDFTEKVKKMKQADILFGRLSGQMKERMSSRNIFFDSVIQSSFGRPDA